MYRTIEILWKPASPSQAKVSTAARLEAGKLWSGLVERHFRIRRLHWKWPSKARWFTWAKGKYPNLAAQSVQQLIADFCEAVTSATQLRKKGHSEAHYPWRRPKFHDIVYTNQSARFRDGWLLLPNGKAGTLRVKMPPNLSLPGRVMEVRAYFGKIHIICEVPEEALSIGTEIGVDLGVNTLIAATDGNQAVLINGREVKATIQWRNKLLASLQSKQSGLKKGSRRWRRTQRRKYRLLDKSRRRVKDILHKATHQVAKTFPHAKAYVGKPFNDAAREIRGTQAQQVSQACCAKIIQQLDYKLAGAIQVDEHYSSQTCPVCGFRHKCRRVYRCQNCGFQAPRDVVGSTNILSIGRHGSIGLNQWTPSDFKYLRPLLKKMGRSSSGGHPACSSSISAREEARTLTP